jgi:flagellar hook-basal body complex protein FliE
MNIASIMSKVIPGTFVPDMSASEAPTVTPIPGLPSLPNTNDKPAASGETVPSVSGVTSFKDTVKQLLSNVNDSMTTSDQNAQDLATGKTNDINKVVTSVEEANLALQYTMAIRSKLLDAYNEIERISV